MSDVELLLTKDGSHTLMSKRFGDSYHAHNGAISESEHVYIEAGFKQLDDNFEQANILELGFGSGMNALLTLKAALLKTGKVERPIHFTTIEAYPLADDLISELNYTQDMSGELTAFFRALHGAPWGEDIEIFPGFTLHKFYGKLADFKTRDDSFNLVYYDAFSPSKQPELWEQGNFERLYPMLMDGAMLVTYCANGQFKRNLKAAGFTVKRYPGALGRREMTRAWKC